MLFSLSICFSFQTGKEAEDAIKKRCPHLTVEIIPKGSSVTRDIRDDRVRVYLDENDKVAQPPMIEWFYAVQIKIDALQCFYNNM